MSDLSATIDHVVITVGDRFETMATAIAAAYMNIPLAHTMGGEVTGTIDESVRHAVTKLAHIHFPANRLAGELSYGQQRRLEIARLPRPAEGLTASARAWPVPGRAYRSGAVCTGAHGWREDGG